MKNSECTFIRDQYTDYKDQSLSNEVRVQVETHLTTCQACQQVFRELDQVIGTLHTLEPVKSSPNFIASLQSKISLNTTQSTWQRIYSSTYTKAASYAIAAGLVVAIGLNFLIEPVNLQSPGAGANYAIEDSEPESPSNSAINVMDSTLNNDSDSLQLNRKTIDSGSSSLQLVSGSNR